MPKPNPQQSKKPIDEVQDEIGVMISLDEDDGELHVLDIRPVSLEDAETYILAYCQQAAFRKGNPSKPPRSFWVPISAFKPLRMTGEDGNGPLTIEDLLGPEHETEGKKPCMCVRCRLRRQLGG
jgi:hypothetical protein